MHFPDAAGHAQSPIDITTNDVIYDSDLCSKPLTPSYKEEETFEVINTGESFKVNIKQASGTFALIGIIIAKSVHFVL